MTRLKATAIPLPVARCADGRAWLYWLACLLNGSNHSLHEPLEYMRILSAIVSNSKYTSQGVIVTYEYHNRC